MISLVASAVLRLVIARQLGTAELGLYFLGAQLGFLPATVAVEVVGAVAYPLFARLQTDLRAGAEAFQTILIGMSVMLFPVCAFLFALAPGLVAHVLGDQWNGTIVVIRILALGTTLEILSDAAVPVLKGYGQPHKVALVELAQSVVVIGCAWGFTHVYGLAGAALAWLPALATAQLLNAIFVRQLLPRPFARLAGAVAIAASSTLGAVVALTIQNTVSGIAGLLSASLMALLTTGALIWVSDHYLALGIFSSLRTVFPRLPLRWVPYLRSESQS
jgi:O-antigen/teichoic acid export membrane protein